MKALLIAALTLFSVSAMAESIDGAVARVEMEEGASCTQVDQTLRKCFNTVCLYTNIYSCSSDVESFDLKVKVIEYTNFSNERIIKARGTKIVR